MEQRIKQAGVIFLFSDMACPDKAWFQLPVSLQL